MAMDVERFRQCLHYNRGEAKEIAFVAGRKEDAEAAKILADYKDPAAVCEKEIKELFATGMRKFPFRLRHQESGICTMT